MKNRMQDLDFEQTHEGWLKVNKDGVEGYVSSEFVKTE